MPLLTGILADSSVLLGAPAENSSEELSMTVCCLLDYLESPTSLSTFHAYHFPLMLSAPAGPVFLPTFTLALDTGPRSSVLHPRELIYQPLPGAPPSLRQAHGGMLPTHLSGCVIRYLSAGPEHS